MRQICQENRAEQLICHRQIQSDQVRVSDSHPIGHIRQFALDICNDQQVSIGQKDEQQATQLQLLSSDAVFCRFGNTSVRLPEGIHRGNIQCVDTLLLDLFV